MTIYTKYASKIADLNETAKIVLIMGLASRASPEHFKECLHVAQTYNPLIAAERLIPK